MAGAPVAGGLSPRIVSGGPTTVHVYVAHSPTLSPRSIARTFMVCVPEAGSTSISCGASHSSIASVSSWHSKTAPGSDVKMKDARTELVVAGGPLWIVVTGAELSLGSSMNHS